MPILWVGSRRPRLQKAKNAKGQKPVKAKMEKAKKVKGQNGSRIFFKLCKIFEIIFKNWADMSPLFSM